MKIIWLLLCCIPWLSIASESPRFAHIFADNMVLQRDKPIRIWGVAGNDNLSLRLAEQTVAIEVDAAGNWNAEFPALKASKKAKTLQLLENDQLVQQLNNILIGDVWFASGQSNMQWKVGQVVKSLPEIQQWIDTADCPSIRIRRINDPVLEDRSKQAVDIKPGNWVKLSPQSAIGFSCVATAYARELNEALEIPIGLIETAWGGKPIEPFIPLSQYDQPLLDDIIKLSNQEKLDALAGMEGGVIIRNPEGYPGAIYNARIAQ